MRKAPTRVLVVATSLVVVAASALAVTASAQSGAANHRTRPFHLTKECPPSTMQGQIGDYCTVTSSNVPAISVGTKIFYAQAAGMTSLDSDVILYAGPGKTATGHCALDFATGLGRCTLSGGTRTLDGIRARVDVSYLGGVDWAWDGTYRFSKDDD
ncbi:MAG TPA: hypothetical protein VK736_10180 [Candidatus Binatia bacterium]|nr:hypothetical protein [Candidatus Binatia bacterium]